MCYFDVILLSDVVSSIGPKISDADTYMNKCINVFSKIYQKFGKIWAVGLVII